MQSLPPEGSPRSWARDAWLASALVVLLLLAFARGFGSEFVFDGPLVVGRDVRLKEFSGINLWHIFSKDYWWPLLTSNLYRPITTFSYWLERAGLGFGASPGPFQAINLILHGLAAWMGYRLLRRLGLHPAPAWCAAVWFGVHPFATEVVPNVVGRADALAMIGMLGAFHAYLDGREGKRSPIVACAWVAVWGLFGVLSKENAASLLALVVWHALTLGRTPATASSVSGYPPGERRMTGLAWLAAVGSGLLITAAVALPKLLLKQELLLESGGGVDNPLRAAAFIPAKLTALSILSRNVLGCIAPLEMSADYSFAAEPVISLPPSGPADWSGLAWAALGLLMIGGVVFLAWRRRWPALAFGLGAALLMLAPTANLAVYIGTIRGDRLVYPAVLPVAGLLCWAVAEGAARLRDRSPDNAATWRRLPAWVAAIYLGCLLSYTHFRCADWRDNEQFWKAAYATAPDSIKTKTGLALWLTQHGTLEQGAQGAALADAAYQQIQDTHDPAYTDSSQSVHFVGMAWGHYGKMLTDAGMTDAARKALDRSAERLEGELAMIDETNATLRRTASKGAASARTDIALRALVDVLRLADRRDEALRIIKGHLAENRLSADVVAQLGWLEIELGDTEGGRASLFDAVLLSSEVASSVPRMVRYWVDTGHIPAAALPFAKPEASADLPKSLVIDPGDPRFHADFESAAKRLADVLRNMHEPGEVKRLERNMRFYLGDPSWSADPTVPSSPATSSQEG